MYTSASSAQNPNVLYEKLGVTRHATQKEIHKAYIKKAIKLHPDKNVGLGHKRRMEFQEELALLNDIYQILSDPLQRRDYDKQFSATSVDLAATYHTAVNLDQQVHRGDINRDQYNERQREALRAQDKFLVPERNAKLESIYERFDADVFNTSFMSTRQADPNDHGYGVKNENGEEERTTDTSYESNIAKIKKAKKIFSEKKFDLDAFNQVFEHNKEMSEAFQRDLALSAADGPEGFDLSVSLPNVSNCFSYNGLLIVGDEMHETRHGYDKWTGTAGSSGTVGYSDYERSFMGHANPESRQISRENKTKYKESRKHMAAIPEGAMDAKLRDYTSQRGDLPPPPSRAVANELFAAEQKALSEKDLAKNKKIVEKFQKQFPQAMLEMYKLQQLETSSARPDQYL